MLILRILMVLALSLAILASCSNKEKDNPVATGPPPDTPSFSTDIQPLLASRCAKPACHGNSTTPTGGLFMGNPPTHASILAASGDHGMAVIVNAGASSNLYIKTTPNPTFGARMPFDGPPYLTTDEQENIKLWIDLGALDN